MAEMMKDGTIRFRDGRIVSKHSTVLVEDFAELMEIVEEAQAAARKIRRTGTEEKIRKDLDVSLDRRVIEAELSKRDGMLLESRFLTFDGRVFNFSLEMGKEYANLSVGNRKGGGLTMGMGAALDLLEVERARNLLGIDPGQPEGYWLEACVQAMRGIVRLERHLGSNKFFLKPNRKAGKSRLKIGKTISNYPKGRKS